jgi:hypothetical protein
MAAYRGSPHQQMNFPWLIARLLDRMGMGEYSSARRFNELTWLFGYVRAINPKESEDEEKTGQEEDKEKFRAIPVILQDCGVLIKKIVKDPEMKLKMKDESIGGLDVGIDADLMTLGFDLQEIIFRCKITDNVRVTEEAVP